MNSNLISKAVRYALVAGAASAIAAPAVFAQSAPQSTTNNQNQNQNANTAQLGKIEVTGTRIKRTSVETAQPITIVTAAEIKDSGFTSIGDVLQNLSQTGTALNNQINNGGNGSVNLDLRNLGAQRLLILVNGHRISTDLANVVDLNTIPTSIIDHIEILQDGASAIYGSDAIAGVVNIITIKNYNGAEANAYLGIYDGKGTGGGWDGKKQMYDFTVGSSSDRSGVVLNVSYVNETPVSAGNRTISKESIWGIGGGSSSTPGGRFQVFGSPCTAANAAGSTVTINTAGRCDIRTIAPGTYDNTAPGLNQFTDFHFATDAYNFAPSNYLYAPSERTAMYAQGHYDLADNITFTTNVLFNNRQSQQALATAPLFLGLANNGTTNGGVNIGIAAGNPYNPFGVDLVPYSPTSSAPGFAQWCAAYGSPNCLTTGVQANIIRRRPLEAGLRTYNQNVDTYHIGMGLNGYFNLMGSEWDWDVGSSFGRGYFSTNIDGQFNTQRIQEALSQSCPTTAGCVPLNLFGGASAAGGTITPAQVAFIGFEEHNLNVLNTRDYTANITGNLFNLPAGPVALAAGYEYLENDGFYHPDALVSLGNTTDNISLPTNGRTKTNAEYVEFNIPLVTDVPFMKEVSLDIANRWSQFKWGGIGAGQVFVPGADHATTARAALRWQATDDLLLRGSWSQGFRIPSISEFYSGVGNNFPAVTDPCALNPSTGLRVIPGATVNANCIASGHDTGLPPGGNDQQQSGGQIQTLFGGNPRLTPERSVSKTLGFVYNPAWLAGFDISVDYYHIELVNTVGSIGPQNLVNGCYLNNVQAYCNQIKSVGGLINSINNATTNIGSTKTDGYDLSTHYKFPSTAIGDFKLGLNMTFLKDFDATVPNAAYPSGFAVSKLAGWVNFPKVRATLSLGWNYGDWSANLSEYFVDHTIEPCTNASVSPSTVFPVCTFNGINGPLKTWSPQGTGQYLALNHVGAVVYTDVDATYHLDSWNADFTFGIQNLFGRTPPMSISAFANSYMPFYNRVPGQFFFGRVSVKF